jgi:hypothetical protein
MSAMTPAIVVGLIVSSAIDASRCCQDFTVTKKGQRCGDNVLFELFAGRDRERTPSRKPTG